MIQKYICFLSFILLATAGRAQHKTTVLVGATIIDVTDFGNSSKDISDAVVVIQDGKIQKTGKNGTLKFPSDARIIDVKGKFIIPGLIDGFSVLNNQGQANAHLYMGVTTISCSVDYDDRRGSFFANANPSPHVKKMIAIPDDELNDKLETGKKVDEAVLQSVSDQIDKLDQLKKEGLTTLFVHHRFPPHMIDKLVKKANELHLNTIGELDLTPYQKALDYQINSFVHTSRYILGAMPDSVSIPYMQAPLDSIADGRYMRFLNNFSIESDKGFEEYARAIATSHTALMPTLSLLYASLPDHKNLWKEPAAVCLDPNDIWLPMDTATGKSPTFLRQKYAERLINIEKGFAKFGVHYLTGSGADAFGSMPGISEHIEISMLNEIGLTRRQAIAAATNNFSIINGWKDIGLIEEGRNADLLILSANPLDDLQNLKSIDMLWLNGEMIERNALLKK